MKGFALLLGGTFLIAGCGQAEGPFVSNLVREAVSPSGNVQQVEMTKQADNSYSGFATVRLPSGITARFNCTANRQGNTTRFEAQCRPVLDQAQVDMLEEELRRSFTSQGVTVLALELTRQDDNHVTGYADIREASGAEGRLPCTGTRNPTSGFPVECRPPATPIPGRQTAQPAPDEGAQPAEQEEAPAEETQ
ncbi:MAG TPA: hypothetical protein VMS43_00340 [Allosphingosinicella sp.]|nr:hypothetical protein [Allosphingosinicella sp.]